MTELVRRKPHAALDLAGRQAKARKIEQLLALSRKELRPIRMLEIGAGSGAIAHYFCSDADPICDVVAVDVVDQRQQTEGYEFRVVEGVKLPFETASFDVVISNHVLEHVGNREQQLTHLREIGRVLNPQGVAYLASPNRWQIVEPHYRLAFLSWLPHALRNRYLALAGKGNFYDCEPLDMGTLECLLSEAELGYRNICVKAFRYVLIAEHSRAPFARMAGRLPDAWLESLRGLCPTHIYLLRHAASMHEAR
ncbi:MAG: class I SAM-dependent methyltransferase [Rhodanobacter sp.]